MPNVLSPRDLFSRPDNMDETVLSSCLNLLLRSLNVADGFPVTQVHKSQICFNVKLNTHLYMHSFLVLMPIMFPIIK